MMWYGTTEVIIEATMLPFPSLTPRLGRIEVEEQKYSGWADINGGFRSSDTPLH